MRLLMAVLRSFGLRQMRSFPLGFFTTTKKLTQSVGSVTFMMTMLSSILSSSSFSLSLMACGMCCTGWMTGVASSLGCMVVSPSSELSPVKRCPYSFLVVSFFMADAGSTDSTSLISCSWREA